MFADWLDAGSSKTLGAEITSEGVNFALFSANAEKVELHIADPLTGIAQQLTLPERSGDVWHGFLPGAKAGDHYHYIVDGPNGPGHLFNSALPLLDPYALAWSKGLDTIDASAGDTAPECVVVHRLQTLESARPRHPWAKTVLYEAHVKGLSLEHPAIPSTIAGTYRALAHPAMIEHLCKLGITAVELLPIQAFNDEPFLQKKGLSNYWGYNPVGFFIADQRYASSCDAMAEFRHAVDCLHKAGIEVILDVVYNHSGEGDLTGRTLSFRGIDNASYYKLDEEGLYLNDTGCGNTLDLGHPAVIRLAMDSLRYWVEVGGVDGFRFDLATTLARDGRHFDQGASLLDCLRQDPVLANVKLIAEPWDIGPDGYKLGAFPHPFVEWNDRFRDCVRRFWCNNDPVLPELAMAMLGSAPTFDWGGRRSWSSLNFITSHDGFTCGDLVRYQDKHNDANLEGNRDGHGHNISNNHGHEGDSGDPAIQSSRLQTQKNLLTTLFLAQGTPMLLAGDEIDNSQQGNNNAYCQDNPIGWLNWPAHEHVLTEFTAALIALRREQPLLSQSHFLHGEEIGGPFSRNVIWRRFDGFEMTQAEWANGELMAIRLDLADQSDQLSILINGHLGAQEFHLEFSEVILDTGQARKQAQTLTLSPRSIVVVRPTI